MTSKILKGLHEFKDFKNSYDLYLFGSRTNLNKSGGDIDLLLIVPQSDFDHVQSIKHYLLAQIKKYIEDQKIDLTIRCREKLGDDPFYQSIEKDLIKLN